ncbi:hypothetical protein [Actinoplanes sp. NPDC020271]|uniref:hypothetical protein n=1 Tax=Actinoplanes sp. NPDC020271 TaxID=3363896 RepID=UPI0037AAEE1D
MLKVDAEALHTIGAEVTATAAELRKLPATGLSPGSSPGSAAAVAARAAEKAWLADLHCLTGKVAGLGRTLTEAAARYARTDDENAGDLRKGSTLTPQPGTTTPAPSSGATDPASKLAEAEPYVAALTGMAFGQALLPKKAP